jgi:hypothetical protein
MRSVWRWCSAWHWKGFAIVVVVGVGMAMALTGPAGATPSAAASKGSDAAQAELMKASSAIAQGPAAFGSPPAALMERAADELATTGVQRPCRMSTMGPGLKELVSWGLESDALLPDYCAPFRDACARGGDCSMYMCCRFGEAFCMT